MDNAPTTEGWGHFQHVRRMSVMGHGARQIRRYVSLVVDGRWCVIRSDESSDALQAEGANGDWPHTEVLPATANMWGYGEEHFVLATGSEQEILSRSSSLSRSLRVMVAALSNSARASSVRPRRSSRSPRTLGSKW